MTVRCLARYGARGTTGRAICREAGVSHGLLRHYFDNPDNLLLETYQQLCDDFLHRFETELLPEPADPWRALERFFIIAFSEEWASSEQLGAWTAFWGLVSSGGEFARVSDRFNADLRLVLERAARRLPAPSDMSMADAISILSAVMDGLWLEYCLSAVRTPRERAVALCNATARRLFAG
ncbi:TetR/AcrR family transcriptional regulator [Flavisphingomonas formosensis]|uniref:TetR/AcrR family transcriptional regulator n=1 Tax=Flavisphingomonas formosensis TaxID=861534 RepID=UPI0018DF36A3|nr:TetR/AcrR family transcriptional regulator [Sphingomonas formosensis]